jgi:hypothetical protein
VNAPPCFSQDSFARPVEHRYQVGQRREIRRKRYRVHGAKTGESAGTIALPCPPGYWAWRVKSVQDAEVEAQRHPLDPGQCGVICAIVMRGICGNQLCSVVLRGAKLQRAPSASD